MTTPNTTQTGERTQFPFKHKLGKGDTITNFHGDVRHRYAGALADYPDRESAAQDLVAAGFKLVNQSEYTGGQTWEVI